jgi:hypothetical protein
VAGTQLEQRWDTHTTLRSSAMSDDRMCGERRGDGTASGDATVERRTHAGRLIVGRPDLNSVTFKLFKYFSNQFELIRS